MSYDKQVDVIINLDFNRFFTSNWHMSLLELAHSWTLPYTNTICSFLLLLYEYITIFFITSTCNRIQIDLKYF